MLALKKTYSGLLLCFLVALPAWFLGQAFPLIGGPVIAILLGIIFSPLVSKQQRFKPGITFTAKRILQYAVILLGFGLNLSVVLQTGAQSLPIIISTIATSLLIAFVLQRALKIPSKVATLVGVGSSICGGSAIAATAPVIDAEDDDVVQAISVIFFFNIIAALVFPNLGVWLGFSQHSGEAFGIFAGTAINDTSSVSAAASTWDSMFHLGSATLDKAITVKLTRTLAIIPITMALGYYYNRGSAKHEGVKLTKIFPAFIAWFILASVITTLLLAVGVDGSVFDPLKLLAKFFIVWAMAAIGLNTNFVTLVKRGGKPIVLGFACWVGITVVSLGMQHLFNLW